jgi:hypothetical protein
MMRPPLNAAALSVAPPTYKIATSLFGSGPGLAEYLSGDIGRASDATAMLFPRRSPLFLPIRGRRNHTPALKAGRHYEIHATATLATLLATPLAT